MKLVFVESEQDLLGQNLPVQVTWSGPWSMQGRLLGVTYRHQPDRHKLLINQTYYEYKNRLSVMTAYFRFP